MVKRQSRQQTRLQGFRMLEPGEVEHEIDAGQLIQPPAPAWDTTTLAMCAALFDRYVAPETGAPLPDHVFCDLPRWVFLEYMVRFHDVLLSGSNAPDHTCPEPIVLSQNLLGWNKPRLFAFTNSIDPMFLAILDRRRLHELDCPARSTLSTKIDGSVLPDQRRFYFGIDYRALPHAPWRDGTVYLYRRSDFPQDFETVPRLADTPIRSIARLHVHPWDWPLLDRVDGVDIEAQTERQRATFRGYPWTDDARIHPHRWQRPLIAEARTYLEGSYGDPVSLSHIAERAGIGPFAFLRMFRAQTGLSPHLYQTLVRIDTAKRLLRQGISIAQAAAEVGFCDQTHLTRHFRQIVGVTPGRYLRMQESPIRAR